MLHGVARHLDERAGKRSGIPMLLHAALPQGSMETLLKGHKRAAWFPLMTAARRQLMQAGTARRPTVCGQADPGSVHEKLVTTCERSKSPECRPIVQALNETKKVGSMAVPPYPSQAHEFGCGRKILGLKLADDTVQITRPTERRFEAVKRMQFHWRQLWRRSPQVQPPLRIPRCSISFHLLQALEKYLGDRLALAGGRLARCRPVLHLDLVPAYSRLRGPGPSRLMDSAPLALPECTLMQREQDAGGEMPADSESYHLVLFFADTSLGSSAAAAPAISFAGTSAARGMVPPCQKIRRRGARVMESGRLCGVGGLGLIRVGGWLTVTAHNCGAR